MKRFIAFTLIFFLTILTTVCSIKLFSKNSNPKNLIKKISENESENNNVNGVWIRTIYGMDFPKTETTDSQKKELDTIIENCKNKNITDIFFQVVPKCDAMYKSNLNPWSEYLTGTEGKDPNYDPLDYLIKKAEKCDINIHAWINPYRVTTKNESISTLSDNNFAKNNQDALIYSNGIPYLDPSSSKVKDHLLKIVEELATNYPKLASIHFDDYFYPENYGDKFTDDSKEQNNLRNVITDTIKSIHEVTSKHNIEFGVSPSGIWKNSDTDPSGSNTVGNESYYAVCADTKLWVENNYIDYIIPQLYWTSNDTVSSYNVLAKWWNDLIANSGTKTKLYIGHGIYKEEVLNDINNQLEYNKTLSNVSGSVFYAYGELMGDDKLVLNK